jgi:uncharacterized damage-inducible protein DinB
MPTIAQTALADLEHEAQNTRRMLERYPTGKDDFKPHAKSWPIQSLAAHLATLPSWGTLTLGGTELDLSIKFDRPAPPTDSAGMVALFETEWARFRSALDGASDAAMMENWTLRMGSHVIFTMPRVAVLRSMVANHMIHHRAQLTMYYRLLDVPVPGMYGPSADEQ